MKIIKDFKQKHKLSQAQKNMDLWKPLGEKRNKSAKNCQ